MEEDSARFSGEVSVESFSSEAYLKHLGGLPEADPTIVRTSGMFCIFDLNFLFRHFSCF